VGAIIRPFDRRWRPSSSAPSVRIPARVGRARAVVVQPKVIGHR